MNNEIDMLETLSDNYSEKIKNKYLQCNNLNETISPFLKKGILKLLYANLGFIILLKGISKISKINTKSNEIKNHIQVLNKICFYLDNILGEVTDLLSFDVK